MFSKHDVSTGLAVLDKPSGPQHSLEASVLQGLAWVSSAWAVNPCLMPSTQMNLFMMLTSPPAGVRGSGDGDTLSRSSWVWPWTPQPQGWAKYWRGMFVTGLQAFALALPSKESFEDTDGPQGAADSRWPLLEFRQRERRQPGK